MVNTTYFSSLLSEYSSSANKAQLLRRDNHVAQTNVLIFSLLANVLFYYLVLREDFNALLYTRKGTKMLTKNYLPILFLVTTLVTLGFVGYYWYLVNYYSDEYDRLNDDNRTASGGRPGPTSSTASNMVGYHTVFFVIVTVLAFLHGLLLLLSGYQSDKPTRLAMLAFALASLTFGAVPFACTGIYFLVSVT